MYARCLGGTAGSGTAGPGFVVRIRRPAGTEGHESRGMTADVGDFSARIASHER